MPAYVPPGYEIRTWREGFIVRTEVRGPDGLIFLPWALDCFTHAGARRKARRHIRYLRRQARPKRVLA